MKVPIIILFNVCFIFFHLRLRTVTLSPRRYLVTCMAFSNLFLALFSLTITEVSWFNRDLINCEIYKVRNVYFNLHSFVTGFTLVTLCIELCVREKIRYAFGNPLITGIILGALLWIVGLIVFFPLHLVQFDFEMCQYRTDKIERIRALVIVSVIVPASLAILASLITKLVPLSSKSDVYIIPPPIPQPWQGAAVDAAVGDNEPSPISLELNAYGCHPSVPSNIEQSPKSDLVNAPVNMSPPPAYDGPPHYPIDVDEKSQNAPFGSINQTQVSASLQSQNGPTPTTQHPYVYYNPVAPQTCTAYLSHGDQFQLSPNIPQESTEKEKTMLLVLSLLYGFCFLPYSIFTLAYYLEEEHPFSGSGNLSVVAEYALDYGFFYLELLWGVVCPWIWMYWLILPNRKHD